MADDDNFDIDIYGDDPSPDDQDTNFHSEAKHEGTPMQTDSGVDKAATPMEQVKTDAPGTANSGDGNADGAANSDQVQTNGTQQISSTGGSTNDQVPLHKQAPRQQGMKRKQGDEDDRPTDPGATSALMINDLNWWISEEDIRGWANQSGCEDELIEVTFNEHKVNGKSKGQVYVHLQTPQAATAFKHQLDSIYKDQAHSKKPTAVFNPPHINPFKTLPKDVPARDKNRGDRSASGSFGNQGGSSGNYNRFNSNSRGNFNSRGGSNMGFQNRNFSGPAGGNMGGFGGPNPMNNFGGPMGAMNNFGGGFNRGGMMGGGMRGGMGNRGGRGGNMGMNPMGGGMNMPMGGNMMGMGGGMMGMGGNMMGMPGGMGGPGNFGASQPHFNPAFFGQNQNMAASEGNWNPHGAKRPRPE